jgi:hypothetical protein
VRLVIIRYSTFEILSSFCACDPAFKPRSLHASIYRRALKPLSFPICKKPQVSPTHLRDSPEFESIASPMQNIVTALGKTLHGFSATGFRRRDKQIFISHRARLYASFISGSSRLSKRGRVCSSFMANDYRTIKHTAPRRYLFPVLSPGAALGIIPGRNRYVPNDGCASARPNLSTKIQN